MTDAYYAAEPRRGGRWSEPNVQSAVWRALALWRDHTWTVDVKRYPDVGDPLGTIVAIVLPSGRLVCEAGATREEETAILAAAKSWRAAQL